MTNRIVYGPVPSWRLGRSLGVDLICQMDGKICSFDCIYCSLGKTPERTIERRNFVDIREMKEELGKALQEVETDYITFSGTGDPALAENLGNAIEVAKEIANIPIAVLTNSALMIESDVREDLAEADEIVGSLDASNGELFKKINRPHPDLNFRDFVKGLREFRRKYKGKLDLEIMFLRENREFSNKIAKIAKSIEPDEVQINTPLRASPTEPLSSGEIEEIMNDFGELNSRSVYDGTKVKVENVVGKEKLRLLKRSKNEAS